ncbi:MAG: T9SS type A sorting domain-containing protein [Chitinophagales bacterium]
MTDITGRTVYSQNITAFPGLNTLRISAGHLAPGMYVLQMRNEESFISRKIIVE